MYNKLVSNSCVAKDDLEILINLTLTSPEFWDYRYALSHPAYAVLQITLRALDAPNKHSAYIVTCLPLCSAIIGKDF